MKRFKKVYIEITNVCNLACSFCPRTLRKPEYMSLEGFERVLDQIATFTDYIYLHVKGEPFLHPHIDKILDLSHKKGIMVNITSNGTLINTIGDKIMGKPALRQVNFSLHSLDKNGLSENIQEYLEDIFKFTKKAVKESNTIITFRLWNLLQGGTDVENITANREIINKIENEFDIKIEIGERTFLDRGIKLKDRIYLNFDFEFKWPEKDDVKEDNKGFCYGLKNQIAVLVDGTVVPCCLDGEGVINLGNINEMDLSEILEGERARSIYEGFSRREVIEELCKKCDYRRRFG